MDTSNATSVANVSASSSTSTIYDLGNMSKDEVVKLFEELGVFQAAILMFSYMYQAQSNLSIAKFADMNEASKASTTAQKMANLVDGKIADVQSSTDKNAKAKLPQDVIDYIKDPRNDISVTGISNLSGDLSAGDLQTVKAAISAKANNLTTVVNNSQLEIQQMSNTLNLLTSARSDVQSLQYRTISAISLGK
ncbi:TPA: type III secretion system LEE translocon filament protein EspA [Escherichia albertii]|uniref:type III secretion system LEE translocon filament protein EspA n=1 Tax=Escherichia albertii TaxID=208962 RepID=UPI001230CA29|nr:type III secretion system LEE translocon filament protein EspA [Escherichia albertii]MCU7330807.1 type III secretion system LEE translocon filament protein EspA [Escherichia albertii]MCU7353583.1 type III secretion system LEE translocon filament protein EspA [Escherichia albertii]UZL98334.1 type III secretion system LEE translocon filament protein EspA [Escherichia albertii]WRT54176.1 type III secretion system LEE translocon filament protein EspA [Escherichia albertii]HEB1519522.1 type III 